MASACESGFDRNDQIVNSLRILGASAHVDNGDGIDWADAEVGDTVTLTALVANPTDIPSVTVTWVTCLPNLNGTLTPCTDEAVLRNPVTLITDPPPGVIELGGGETIQYLVPPEVQPLLDQLKTRADQNVNAECAIYLELPVIIIAQGGGSVVSADTNVRLSPWSETGPDATDPSLQYYVRNANPSIAQLNIPNDLSTCIGQTLVSACQTDADCGGGTCSSDGWCPPATPFPTGKQTICGQIPAGDIQTYYYCGMDGPDGTEMEEPSITWYETAGSQGSISNSNRAGAPDLASRTFETFTRPPGPFTLYGVVRDGRDGLNWVAQDFQ
jgi:hypothetical protein